MITLICKKCGREFNVKPYRKDKAQYCSNICRYKPRELIIRETFALVSLSCGYFSKVDLCDVERISKYNWYVDRKKHSNYAMTHGIEKGHTTFLHRFILCLDKNDLGIDHIDRDGLNNLRSNLRICTQSQNLRNQIGCPYKTSKYKGVCQDKNRNKWMAGIRFNRKLIFLGRYSSEIEAAKAYDSKAKELFGEFARLNFAG